MNNFKFHSLSNLVFPLLKKEQKRLQTDEPVLFSGSSTSIYYLSSMSPLLVVIVILNILH